MHILGLATDYDGTIAHDGAIDAAAQAALERFGASGRKLILVTGRELPDLRRVMSRLSLFDRVVAENGALLFDPATGREELLACAPPERFVAALRRRGAPLSVGRAIVATWEPHQRSASEAIDELGLDLQVILNKGAVMVLPAGVDKASGLAAALQRLGLRFEDVVGVGDAENDEPFMRACGFSVAVANALPMLKAQANFVTQGRHGAGVAELIDAVLKRDAGVFAKRR